MLRIDDINKAYLKRTIRPLYDNTQATPKSLFLDPAWDNSVDIYPGMCAMKTTGDLVTVINGTGVPYGLFGIYEAPTLGIPEVTRQGINAMPVWVLGVDAEFQILSPAFDDTASWVDPGDGTIALVFAITTGSKRGKLCPAGAANASTVPVARLLRVDSATSITIGGLAGRVA